MITEEVFELTAEAQVDAFLKIAKKKRFKNKVLKLLL